MRKKALQPDSSGTIWVNVGIKPTKTGKRSQGKFNLGENRKDAERRLSRIEELWELIERKSAAPLWNEFTFEIAKRLGKGEMQFSVSVLDGEDSYEYATRLNKLSNEYPCVNFVAEDFEEYESGNERLEEFIRDAAIATAEDLGLTERPRHFLPSDGSLHVAMDQYIHWIKQEYFDRDEEHVNDNGMTKIRQVKTLKDHLRDRPLSTVDFQAVDEMFGYFRKRPLSKRTRCTMKRKSCQNYLGELGRFFDWLDLKSNFSWQLPERFNRIKRSVDELESDIAAEAADIFTFSDAQLSLIYKYAGPLDRLLILLGLNCAFGADQSGRLRIGEVHLDKKPPCIRRIRRKKKVLGQHYLWNHTRLLLVWALKRRGGLANEESGEVLIINQKGKPFWRKTAGGNRTRDIANYWDRLLERIREDHSDFPKVGFNTLRDTSVHRVRAIGGQEIALIHATHKHHSPDVNLRRYSNAPWLKVFRAQQKLERRLSGLFEAVPDPTAVPKQAYISLARREKILELHEAGQAVPQIAKVVGISVATVYRTVAAYKEEGSV